ncbi:hypothetical protein LJC34_00485 [Oscillospiraceae bacterium OttesenSCG-928-G22]|nr:hypothetical protein [Oscillospiraceae bacterium OttesenSCG-928-G22]
MASFYWYEREPELYENEVAAMRIFFPQFELYKLNDGRLSWVGDVRPRAEAGARWTLQLVYDNNHPDNSTYGGSIRVYSIEPDLDLLYKRLGRLPHVLKDGADHIYLCTARAEDFEVNDNRTTTAVSALGWACKWIFLFEEWLEGKNVGDELFGHVY